MTQEQIEKLALHHFPVRHKQNKKSTGKYDPNYPRIKAYTLGVLEAKVFYTLPIMVKDLGDGRFDSTLTYKDEKRYFMEDFDYFAIITML